MKNLEIYPIKLDTLNFEKIWGGQKIKNILGVDIHKNLKNCGETWILSSENDMNCSTITNGTHKGKPLNILTNELPESILGKRGSIINQGKFPLLIKYIDASEDLSVQVHPDDEIALKRHQSKGKTEMWYVLDADENTSLISGFSKNTNRQEVQKNINTNNLSYLLNQEPVNNGDCFFLPAGRIHTIGKGSLILEIQQSSDITYRVYDFDRKDDNGNTRELHIKEALSVLDYKKHKHYKNEYNNNVLNSRIQLASCEYFTTNKLNITKNQTITTPSEDSFTVYICIEGNTTIIYKENEYILNLYECILIPADINEFDLKNRTDKITLIETYV